MVSALASHARGHRFESYYLHHFESIRTLLYGVRIFNLPSLTIYIVNYSVGKQEVSYYLIDFCPYCVKVHLSTLKYVADIGIML